MLDVNAWFKAIAGVAVGLMIAATVPARADRVRYQGVVDLSAEVGPLRAEHHHDWGRASHVATTDPFAADNEYSYLRLLDRVTGTELFRRSVPALTHIWISPDAKYVVGISNVMFLNPYQLVVFSRSGDRLLERNLVGAPGTSQSVTNWIEWYKRPVPQMKIGEDGTTATLSVEDSHGGLRQFQFPAVH
ncbi:hypothetical protein XH93_06345 [Bradyrhizobium sp. CCBAU 51753]|nr:hypothetical protein XH93_06345 [Bradyrhizobium sp. CCBAU 51753]